MGWKSGSVAYATGFETQGVTGIFNVGDGVGGLFSDDTTTFNTGACSFHYTHLTTDGDGVRGLQSITASRALTLTFAFRLDSSTTPAASNRGVGICGFYWTAGGSSSVAGWGIYWDGTNYQGCIMNAGGLTSSTPAWRGSQNLSTDTWYYWNVLIWNPNPNSSSEFWKSIFTIHDSSGTLVERSPVTRVGQGTALATQNSFYFGNSHGIAGWHLEYNIDDFIVIQGGVLGPRMIKMVRCVQDADGTDNGMTSSAGGAKYLDTDEVPTNSDTDYNKNAADLSVTQTYTHSGHGVTLAGSEEFFFANVRTVWKKAAGTGNQFGQCRLRDSGTVNNGASVLNPASYTYIYYPAVRRLATSISIPGGDGGGGWDMTSLDNLEFGPAVLRVSGTGIDIRCSQVILEVAYGLAPDSTYNGGAATRDINNQTGDRKVIRSAIGV